MSCWWLFTISAEGQQWKSPPKQHTLHRFYVDIRVHSQTKNDQIWPVKVKYLLLCQQKTVSDAVFFVFFWFWGGFFCFSKSFLLFFFFGKRKWILLSICALLSHNLVKLRKATLGYSSFWSQILFCPLLLLCSYITGCYNPYALYLL